MSRFNILTGIFVFFLILVLFVPGCGGGGDSGGGVSGGGGGGGSVTPVTGPTVTGVQPASPTIGDECSINGSGFGARELKDNGESYVSFVSGATVVKAATYNLWSASVIKVIVPALTAGQSYIVTVNIVSGGTVTSSSSTATTGNTVIPQAPVTTSPTITTINPQTMTIGTTPQIAIAGRNFGAGTGSVFFGSVQQSTITTWSDTQVVCNAPANLTQGIITVKVRTNAGLTSNEASLTVSPAAANQLTGKVYDIFTGTGVASAVVAIGGFSAESNANGNYTTQSKDLSKAETRMTVTKGTILTRSMPVNNDGGVQDISVVPSSYNTTMLRAYCWGTGQASYRWNVKPTRIVVYNQLYASNPAQSVSQATLDAVATVLQDEFFLLADGYFSGTPIEYFNGRPEDDTRLTGAGDGSFYGSGIIAVYFSNTFTGNITHPFDALGETNPLLEPSVMNYSVQYSASYSTYDSYAYKLFYHRAPGNVAPDRDPDGYLGYKKEVITVIFKD